MIEAQLDLETDGGDGCDGSNSCSSCGWGNSTSGGICHSTVDSSAVLRLETAWNDVIWDLGLFLQNTLEPYLAPKGESARRSSNKNWSKKI